MLLLPLLYNHREWRGAPRERERKGERERGRGHRGQGREREREMLPKSKSEILNKVSNANMYLLPNNTQLLLEN